MGRALELDPAAPPRPLALLGHALTVPQRRHGDAPHPLGRAEAAAPNDAETRLWSSLARACAGDPKEGVRRAGRAVRPSPEDPPMFRCEHLLPLGHLMAGEFERAAQRGLRSRRRNGSCLSHLRATAAAPVALGRPDEARDLARRSQERQPEFRVSGVVPRAAFRDPSARKERGRRLPAAGQPP